MRAALLGFAIMLVFGASGSAAARVLVLDKDPRQAPVTAPISPNPTTDSPFVLLIRQ